MASRAPKESPSKRSASTKGGHDTCPSAEPDGTEHQALAPRDLALMKAMGVDVEDPKARQAAAVILEQTMSMSSSPYPAPDMLAEYPPEIAARIIATIDQQIAHRQALERETVMGSERRQDRGQMFAFIISASSFVAAGGLFLAGLPAWVSVAAMVLGIGGPNTASVLVRLMDKRRRD